MGEKGIFSCKMIFWEKFRNKGKNFINYNERNFEKIWVIGDLGMCWKVEGEKGSLRFFFGVF